MSDSKKYILPLLIIAVLFFVIGFGVGISGFLTPYLQSALQLSVMQSYLITAAIFSAFILFGKPAGWIIRKTGYKNSIFIALIVMAAGMALFVPSAHWGSFPVFLLALFVGGIGNTLLQAAVNPYVTIVGPTDSAAMRLCLMGIMNKMAWWLGPLFLGLFMDLQHVQLEQIDFPFYMISLILVGLSVFIYFSGLPEVKAEGEEAAGQTAGDLRASHFPHLILGAIALFVYVGVETLPMSSIIGFAKTVYGDNLTNPAQYAMYVPLGMFVGYISGVILIPKVLSQVMALRVFAVIGILAALGLILLRGELAIYCLSLIGFANSVMWGAIWPLSIADLGAYTKQGASLLVMSIVGGAIIPLLFGAILDVVKTDVGITTSNYQLAYGLLVPAYLYILFYATLGYKFRKK